VHDVKNAQLSILAWQQLPLPAAADGRAVGRAGAALRVCAAEQQQKQQVEACESTRQLLWQLLVQAKPAAGPWYQHGAIHYSQQQQKLVGSNTMLKAAAAAAGLASVPECTSPALWSTLTHSLATDLLLVPPSIRDLLGNGWAAGVGRLGAGGDGNDGGNSSSSSVAARMLAVQYARAARKQYVQVRTSAHDA
jgi:hypothetical protein